MVPRQVALVVMAAMVTLGASSVLAAPPAQSEVAWPVAVRAIDAGSGVAV